MAFDPLASDFYGFQNALTDREKEFLTRLRAFLEAEVRPIADDHWRRGAFPMHLIPALHELGLIGLGHERTRPFPNSAVFRGWVALELARVDAGVGTYLGVQNGLVLGSLALCGSPEQQERWMPRLASGEVIGAFGLTEPDSGSDSARGLKTVARRRGDGWVLNGTKRWIGNATFSDITVIWARDEADDQVKGFIVPTDADGYLATRIEGKQSLRTVQNADITLTDVAVDDDLRLARANSFADTARVLRETRAEVAWAAIGVAVGAYEAALDYTRTRTQFGKPLAAHQLVQEHLVTCMAGITTSIALCTRVSQMLDEGVQRDEHSALAKAYATERMRETVRRAREVMGGNGIVMENGVMRFLADAEALYSYEGTREVNTLIVGRALTGFGAFV